jgi:hypothetical protein
VGGGGDVIRIAGRQSEASEEEEEAEQKKRFGTLQSD